MTGESSERSVPEGLEGVAPEAFPELDTGELEVLLGYVSDLIEMRDDVAAELGVGPNEVLTKAVSRGGYLEVHKRTPCAEGCESCPHGPYVYHVRREPRPSGETRLHWSLIGPEVGDSN